MNDRELQDKLRTLLEELIFDRDDADDPADPGGEMAEYIEGIRNVVSYEDVGIMTTDKGLVIECDDESEFQITIVQSR